MNERLEDLMYLSGMTAQGCWDSMDDYQRQAVEKFAQLIVKECAKALDQTIAPPSHPMNSIGWKLKQHFGIEE